MNRPDFAELALALLKHTQAEATPRNDGHTGLTGEGDNAGALDDAAHRIGLHGDLGSALAYLDTAIQRAHQPVGLPLSGRNQMQRYQAATATRAHLLTVAQIARVLVLDALKASGPATLATSATHTERA
jgi:hypothetical protein